MKYFLLVICTVFATSVTAQFNSKVGYSAMYLNMDKVSSIFESYSVENEDLLASDLSPVSFAHGLELGVRYRISNLTFELGIISGQGETTAVLQTGAEEKWKVSNFDYHFNVVQHINNWSFGAGVARQQLRLRQFNSTTSQFVDMTHEQNWNGRVFFQVEVPSRLVSFAFRPYYQFSFDSYDTTAVSDALGVDAAGDQSLKIFGLSILFFNGPQPGW